MAEACVTLAVVAILSGLAAPPMRAVVDNQRIRAGTEDFVLALRVARSEAVKRNTRVAVCKASTGICTKGGAWDQGWLVFEDRNNNGTLDANETLLRAWPALAQDLRLRGNSPVDDYVSFTPMGRTRSTSNALQMGTITLCKLGSSTTSREIVINNSGRVNVISAGLVTCR
jgi:type IV fimbrial biogenesis protein FimT